MSAEYPIRKQEREDSLIDQLQARATNPESLEAVCRELGIESHLFNVFLAINIDLSHMFLGQGIMIPTMISSTPGGRQSILELKAGERVLTGVFVNGKTLALRYLTRETGESKVAPGDKYYEEWLSRSGNVLSTGFGKVETVDHSTGNASIRLTSSPRRLGIGDINLPDMDCECTAVVILWSLLCWADCDCKPAKTKKIG